MPPMSEILSIFSNESSFETFIFRSVVIFNALNQRSSKLVRMSYAAGPSILECKSCHGCLGQPVTEPCLVYYKLAQSIS